MKKLILLSFVLLTLSTLAQNDYQYRLSSFMSENGTTIFTYGYENPGDAILRSVHETDMTSEPTWELIDSLHYDDQGRIVQVAGHQFLDGEWRRVYFIDYTYNEMGLRATRKNYNDFNDGYGPILGGIYYYNYDEEGRMTDWLLDFDNYEFQQGELTYNENGLLVEELIQQDAFIGVMENYGLIQYYYDENNNATEIITSSWAYTQWSMLSVQFNTYDELGNCREIINATPDGLVQEKRVYNYDVSVLAENVFYYSNPENKFPTFPQMHNMVTSYESWLFNQNSGNLDFVGNYYFEYEQIGEVGLSDEEQSLNNVSIYPNPAQDFIIIDSENVEYVEVIDIYGRVITASEIKGETRIDMSKFANGIYFVRLHSNGSTAVQKVVKE